jgi:excisionase family DNA binding protein
MTVAQLGAYLAVHPATIYRLLNSRQIPAFRLGSDWRFRRSDIEQWISDKEAKLEDAGEHESKPRDRPPKSRR